MKPIRTQEMTPWHPRESARPLLAWSAEQREALGAAIARALAVWREAWGLPQEIAAVPCAPATSEAVLQDGWQPLGAAGTAWLRAPADAPRQLAALLFGMDGPTGPIAAAAGQACAHDATQKLAEVLRLATGAAPAGDPPPGLGQPWSGAVHAALPGAPGWSLLLGPDAMQAWCRGAGLQVHAAKVLPANEPLCAATEALGGRSLPLNVELSGCELDLGTLQSLQLGDVVRLRHELQAPARLTDGQGQVLFDGFLVSQQGRKAIELARRQER